MNDYFLYSKGMFNSFTKLTKFPNGNRKEKKMTKLMKEAIEVLNKKTSKKDVMTRQDEITKKMKVPQMTDEQIETHLNTFPVDVMTTQLMTKTVEKKPINWNSDHATTIGMNRMFNWYAYYKQIENNLVIGAKAVFLVCRDLYDASRSLSPDDFDMLKKKVHLSEGTISKYLKIGSNTTCRELFSLNKLPESWTTMYKIAQQKDKEKIKSIKDKVDLGSTASDIDVFMGVMKKELAPIWSYDGLKSPKDFIKIAYDTDNAIIDPNALEELRNKVTAVVEKTVIDFNKSKKGYSLHRDKKDKRSEDMKVAVAVNNTLLDKVYDSALAILGKIKGKKTKKNIVDAFNLKRNEAQGTVLAQ